MDYIPSEINSTITNKHISLDKSARGDSRHNITGKEFIVRRLYIETVLYQAYRSRQQLVGAVLRGRHRRYNQQSEGGTVECYASGTMNATTRTR